MAAPPADLPVAELAAQIRKALVDAAAQEGARMERLSPGDNVGIDRLSARLPALELLKSALGARAARAFEKSLAAYRSARAQELIAKGIQDWNATDAPQRPEPIAGAPGLPRARLSPSKRRGIAFGDLVSLMRAVGALPAARAEAYRARFLDWFSKEEVFSDDAAALRKQESMKPARLDTAIFHQAGEKDDAIGEIVNNAIDAAIAKAGLRELVGQFGVGSFQLYQELEEAGDRVTLETAVAPGQLLRVTLTIEEKADPARIAQQIRILCEEVTDPAFGTGTSVRVHKAEGLSAERRQALSAKLAAKLGGGTRAPVLENGRVINPLEDWRYLGGGRPTYLVDEPVRVGITDTGYEVRDHGPGMSAETVLEKFLLPRQGTKSRPPAAPLRLRYRGEANGRASELRKMKVTLGIAGTGVESFEVEGLGLPDEVFLELSPDSWLPESRNKIAVTPELWTGLGQLLERALAGGIDRNLGLVNALAAITVYLENPRTHPEAGKTGENFTRRMAERLDRVPGLKKLAHFQGADGVRAYAMRFRSKDHVYLRFGPNLLFDEEVYDRYKDFPLLLNLLLNFRIGYGDDKPSKGEFLPPQTAAMAPEPEVIDAADRLVQGALSTESWYEALPEARRRRLRENLKRSVGAIAEADRHAVLAAKLSRLGAYADFARKIDLQADWTRLIDKPVNTPYVDEKFSDVPMLTTIGGKPAFAANKGDHVLLYIDGREVWSGVGVLKAPPIDLGDGWAMLVESHGTLTVVADYVLDRTGEHAHVNLAIASHQEAQTREARLFAFQNRPALLLTFNDPIKTVENSRLFVVCRDEVYFQKLSLPADLEINQLLAVGGKLAIELYNQTYAEVYYGGERVWHGPPADIQRSQFINDGGKLVFAAKDRDGLDRIFIDGRPTGEGFKKINSLVHSGGRVIYVAETVDGGIATNIMGEPITLPSRSIGVVHYEVGRLAAADGHYAFSIFVKWEDNSYGPTGIIWTNNSVREINGLDRYADPFWIGDEIAYMTREADGRRRLWIGERRLGSSDVAESLFFSALGRSARQRGQQFFIDDEPAGNLSEPEIPVLGMALNGRDSFFYPSFDPRSGRWSVRRVRIGARGEFDPASAADASARKFVRAHAGDLRESGRPWGARYLKGILEKTPEGLRPAEARPLLPFLNETERTGLQAATARRFSAYVANEPWDKVERMADFIRGVRPLTQNSQVYNRWIERWFDIVDADWSRAHELLGQLEAEDDHVRGFFYLTSRKNVEIAPGRLRGYLDYLNSERAEILKERAPERRAKASLITRISDFSLSLFTLAHRQRARQVAARNLSLAGYRKILQSLAGYETRGTESEIASAIRGQDSAGRDAGAGDMVWLRELIQNARDALRRAWREGTLPRGRGNVSVDSFKRGREWVVRVHDDVGMSLHTLVNYFFPLDPSDKAAGIDAGRFGQGVYTLFGDFDEVRIKTGTGDGKIDDVVITRKDGRLWVQTFTETAGKWRGTSIERIKRLDRVQKTPAAIEAAFLTAAVHEFAGGVQDVDVRYQGEKINETAVEVEALDFMGRGRLRLIESPSRLGRVTQDGLPVSDPGLREELTARLPDWMRRLLSDKGDDIELPGKIPLARSRMGIAGRQEFIGDLQNAVLALGIRRAVQLYFDEGLTIPELPSDFYMMAKDRDTDPKTVADARALNAGRWSMVDWNHYRTRDRDLGQLMALTEANVKGRPLSPWKVREQIMAGKPPKNLEVAEAVQEQWSRSAASVEKRRLDDTNPQHEYTEAEIAAAPDLRDFRALNFEVLQALGIRDGWYIRFYSQDVDTLATFRGRTISWNLFHTRHLAERWEAILRGDDAGIVSFFTVFLETFIHEYTHFSDGDWTHHADETLENGFAWRMKANFEKLIRAGFDIPAAVARFRRQRGTEP